MERTLLHVCLHVYLPSVLSWLVYNKVCSLSHSACPLLPKWLWWATCHKRTSAEIPVIGALWSGCHSKMAFSQLLPSWASFQRIMPTIFTVIARSTICSPLFVPDASSPRCLYPIMSMIILIFLACLIPHFPYLFVSGIWKDMSLAPSSWLKIFRPSWYSTLTLKPWHHHCCHTTYETV